MGPIIVVTPACAAIDGTQADGRILRCRADEAGSLRFRKPEPVAFAYARAGIEKTEGKPAGRGSSLQENSHGWLV